jgi:CRISPR/Cas system-associated exonuclease Cas4 (RecB family)
MKTIRASEIGTYLFCRRAFWYQLQGIPSENKAELLGGSDLHDLHGRAVASSGCLRALAYALLLGALALLTIYAVQEIL